MLWLGMTLLFAIGYTVVEWRSVFGSDCSAGPGAYLGWPTALCERGPTALEHAFMVIAAAAQACVLGIAWIIFSAEIWLGELLFGPHALRLQDAGYARVGRLFTTAAWGWAVLLVALYLARLWSFHFQLATTATLLETIFDGLPGSLFDIRAHSQPDVGSMIASLALLGLMQLPFALLRLRVRSSVVEADLARRQRVVGVFGAVAAISMFFPRIGFFAMGLVAVVAILLGWRRRTLLA
jgi:hypothetical protein